jgi:hypothetical protein
MHLFIVHSPWNYVVLILKVDTQGENFAKLNSLVQDLFNDDYIPPKQHRIK